MAPTKEMIREAVAKLKAEMEHPAMQAAMAKALYDITLDDARRALTEAIEDGKPEQELSRLQDRVNELLRAS